MPIANTWFGTTFALSDDHRTNISGGGDLAVFDISTTFFSLTIGQQQTAFFRNQSGGMLHLTYTSLPGVGGGLSHFDQFGPRCCPWPSRRRWPSRSYRGLRWPSSVGATPS